MILCREEYAKKINSAVFPGQQGGPLEHVIAGKAVALKIAAVRAVPRAPAAHRRRRQGAWPRSCCGAGNGVNVLTGGTDVHLVLVDLRESELDGKQAEDRLHDIGITVNRNAVPFDPRPPTVSSRPARRHAARSPPAASRPRTSRDRPDHRPRAAARLRVRARRARRARDRDRRAHTAVRAAGYADGGLMSLRRALACWAAAALLLAGCGGSDEPRKAPAQQTLTVATGGQGGIYVGVGRRLRARHHQAARGLPRRRHPHHGLGREPRAPARRPGADRAHARRHRARRRRGPRGVRPPRGAQGARPDLPELRPARHARGARASARSPTSRASASASARPTPAPRWSPTACSTSRRSAGSSASSSASPSRPLRSSSGQLDAFFWSGGVPTAAVAELAKRTPIALVDLRRYAREMRSRWGGVYERRALPAGAYGLDVAGDARSRSPTTSWSATAWTPRSPTT